MKKKIVFIGATAETLFITRFAYLENISPLIPFVIIIFLACLVAWTFIVNIPLLINSLFLMIKHDFDRNCYDDRYYKIIREENHQRRKKYVQEYYNRK